MSVEIYFQKVSVSLWDKNFEYEFTKILNMSKKREINIDES